MCILGPSPVLPSDVYQVIGKENFSMVNFSFICNFSPTIDYIIREDNILFVYLFNHNLKNCLYLKVHLLVLPNVHSICFPLVFSRYGPFGKCFLLWFLEFYLFEVTQTLDGDTFMML